MAENESQEIWTKKCQLYIFRDREDESRRGFEETRYTDIFLNRLKKKLLRDQNWNVKTALSK